jgi:hypothetical protein
LLSSQPTSKYYVNFFLLIISLIISHLWTFFSNWKLILL